MKKTLGVFEGYGIELEYMIVHNDTLVPLPISDKILADMAGEPTMSIECGEVAWSNELAMHVIELKSNGPKSDLPKMHQNMFSAIGDMNDRLKKYDAFLLPSGMHPFFNPNDGSLRLWDSEDSEIYSAYDRIFGCKGHGWGNLQAIHINLPFKDDVEFRKLHTAIRLVLPLLPAVAASSPYVEGKRGPLADSRVHFYLANQRKIASIIGDAIPEAVKSRNEYEAKILKPMYKDIAEFDPDGLLQHEWLNSRAAIARFDRNAIEIRILDIQECLHADFSLISAVVAAIKSLYNEENSEFEHQFSISQSTLKKLLRGSLDEGGKYSIQDREYTKAFSFQNATIGQVCSSWLPDQNPYSRHLKTMSSGKNLAERLLNSCGAEPSRQDLVATYSKLSQCLAQDLPFCD